MEILDILWMMNLDFIIDFWAQIFNMIKQHPWELFLGVTGVAWWVIQIYGKNYFNNQKRIVIEENLTLNINNTSGLLEPYISNSSYYSNFILNKITLNNKRSIPQAITKIKISKIKKKAAYFSDIQYDGGFYESSQKFVLMAYNNGNVNGLLGNKIIKFISYEKNLQNPRTIKSERLKNFEVASGELRSIVIESLNDIAMDFVTNTKLNSLRIEVQDENGIQEPGMFLGLEFDRNQKSFRNYPRGASLPPVDIIPVFNLTTDKSCVSIPCSQVIQPGSGTINFAILLDRTCRLEYRITLFSGKKKINNLKKYKVNIRVPIYKQEHGRFLGSFYWLFEKNSGQLRDEFTYSTKEIEFLDKNLIYDKYYAARQFYKVKL